MKDERSRMVLTLFIDGKWLKCRALKEGEKLDPGDVLRHPHKANEYGKLSAPGQNRVNAQDFAKGRYFKVLGEVDVGHAPAA